MLRLIVVGVKTVQFNKKPIQLTFFLLLLILSAKKLYYKTKHDSLEMECFISKLLTVAPVQ